MPKIIKIIGSGMTERGIVAFDWSNREDVTAQIDAGINTLNRSSFELHSRQLSAIATSILSAADLPTDPRVLYLVTGEGEWGAVEDGTELDEELASALPLSVAVCLCGYPDDSPEGFAAELLMTLEAAKDCLVSGDVDSAMALAFQAGETAMKAGMKEVFEPDYLAGERVREGGRKAHAATHGTAEEKAARRAAYQEAFDAAKGRGLARMDAYRAAARQFGVSVTTIRRAIARR
jgi:hypothetical protein